ncbi:MAG: uracil phosphoribosyltransferase [Bacteroidota bacterium]|nr:uracil phosphoribosyltransferase [Bacteroidota bacterium]
MKDFFYAVQDFFETFLFVPFNLLREVELENWWFANAVTWLFLAILIVCFVYWMLQLKGFNDNDEEDKSISSHSYL